MERQPYVGYLPRFRRQRSAALPGQLLPWGDPYICQLQRQLLDQHDPHAEIALPVFPVTGVPDVSRNRQRAWSLRRTVALAREMHRPAVPTRAQAV